MHINHYIDVFDQFLENRRNHPESNGRKVPEDTGELPIGGIRIVDSAVMIFDIAGSKKASNKLDDIKFARWIGQALHLFFHCVDDYDGLVDKYTGDGAMVSFSFGSKEGRCLNALNCALKISDILKQIINPKNKKIKWPIMNVRIGIDFGTIRIERIGKKTYTHLIITGSQANFTKTLEALGKNQSFDYYTTIILGYDAYYYIPNKDLKSKDGKSLLKKIKDYSFESPIDNTEPYPIYLYTGRYRID